MKLSKIIMQYGKNNNIPVINVKLKKVKPEDIIGTPSTQK